MFTCRYCGVHYQTFHPICPSCGAPYQVESPEKTEAKLTCDRIRSICDQYLNKDFNDSRDFRDGESISDKRMETLRDAFRVFPNGKEIYLYCDTSPLRNGKRGFLVCEDGVYWQNTWTTPTHHNFLNWDTLKKREIAHKRFDLDLGKGDIIDMAGLGSNILREKVANFFKQIHTLLNEHSKEKR